MKYKNKIRAMLLTALTLVVTSCSDFNDYNTNPELGNAQATQTLWQNIQTDVRLSDFASVLKRVGYDKVLDMPQAYTVWAPVNGAINMDSLSKVKDDKVLKEFVNNHIASYVHREGDVNDSIIYMLNGKLQKFNNKNTGNLTFAGQRVNLNNDITTESVYNHPSTNGLLYSISSPAVFRMNLYDFMYELNNISDSLADVVKKYDIKILDEQNSIKGAIVDGIQTYDDEVYVYGNTLFCNYKLNGYTHRSRYGCTLNDEDSAYMMIIPTNEAWKIARDKMSQYYKYAAKTNYQNLSNSNVTGQSGSLASGKNSAKVRPANSGSETLTLTANAVDVAAYWQDSLVTRFLTRDLVYSLNNKRYNNKLQEGSTEIGNDSIINTTNVYHTGIDSLRKATDEIVTLSNGYARIVHDFPFRSWESSSFAPEIKVLNLGRCYPAGYYETKSYRRSLVNPAICTLDEGENYLNYYKQKPKNADNATPIEFDFYLDDVLSTAYNVYIVTVPECFENPKVENKRKYSLFVDINYIDDSGKQIAGRFNPVTNEIATTPAKMKKIDPILCSEEKVDTVFLGTVKFGTCYKGLRTSDKKSVAPNIQIMHTTKTFKSDPTANEYDNILRVANVILRPVEYDEYKSSKKQ